MNSIIKKTIHVKQEFNTTTQRLSTFKQTVIVYFMGIKVYSYIENHTEEAIKTEPKSMGFK